MKKKQKKMASRWVLGLVFHSTDGIQSNSEMVKTNTATAKREGQKQNSVPGWERWPDWRRGFPVMKYSPKCGQSEGPTQVAVRGKCISY